MRKLLFLVPILLVAAALWLLGGGGGGPGDDASLEERAPDEAGTSPLFAGSGSSAVAPPETSGTDGPTVASRPTTVRGSVRFRETGEPLTAGSVRFSSGRGNRFLSELPLASDGTFEGTLPWSPTRVVVPRGRRIPTTSVDLGGVDLSRPILLELDHVATVFGVVIGGDPPAGIAGAQVTLGAPRIHLGLRQPDYDAVVTGADGSFRMEGFSSERPEPATILLEARHAQWQPRVAEVVLPQGSGDVRGVRIDLERGVVVEGRAEAEDRPVAGVGLFLLGRADDDIGFGRSVRVHGSDRAGPEGRFRIDGVSPAEDVELWASASPGQGAAPRLTLDLRQDRRDLVVTLPPARRIRVRPHYPQGVSPSKRSLAVVFRVGESGPWRSGGGEGTFAAEKEQAVTIRAFGGRISMEDLDILFRGDAVVPAGAAGEVVVPMHPMRAPDVPFDWRDVEGERFPGARAVLLVRYVDAVTGEPIEAARVLAFGTHAHVDCDLDLDRRYLLAVGLGEQVLSFEAEGYAPAAVTFAPDEPSVIPATIRLRRSR